MPFERSVMGVTKGNNSIGQKNSYHIFLAHLVSCLPKGTILLISLNH